MNTILQKLESELGIGKIKQGEPMSSHTTFKIGGPAEYYLAVEKTEDLIKAVKTAHELGIPIIVFGGGSNVIVADHGIKGLVVKNNCRRFEVMSMSGRIKNQRVDVSQAALYAESGVIMGQLVRYAIDQGLSGLEYQLGLPGTVGGALYMNSNFPKKGAYVGDVVLKARLVTKEGDVKDVDNAYFRFAYDKSILQETSEIVLSVVFKLEPGDKTLLWERAAKALTHRTESQPKGLSAGCTFRNISIADAFRIPTPDKITSAGYLIDRAGLKGRKIGGAMISDMHANFILNTGDAKAQDIVDLTHLVKDEVKKKFGVDLVLEVKTVGF